MQIIAAENVLGTLQVVDRLWHKALVHGITVDRVAAVRHHLPARVIVMHRRRRRLILQIVAAIEVEHVFHRIGRQDWCRLRNALHRCGQHRRFVVHIVVQQIVIRTVARREVFHFNTQRQYVRQIANFHRMHVLVEVRRRDAVFVWCQCQFVATAIRIGCQALAWLSRQVGCLWIAPEMIEEKCGCSINVGFFVGTTNLN